MEQYAIGADVGGTKVSIGLYDAEKNCIESYMRPSDSSLEAREFFAELADEFLKLMDKYNVKAEQMIGIGMGVPSFIYYDTGHIIKTTNLTKIKDFPAKAFLTEALGGKIRIEIDNDSRTAALAEHRMGAGRGFANMLYCPVSTGISSGIIIDGKAFRGSYGFAGESGHAIATPGKGVMCGCGNRGCYMSYISGSMICAHIREWISLGEETLMLEIAGSADKITTVTMVEAYRKNDPMAKRALEQMADYLGVWTFNLYVTLNINCFVFGGGLVDMGDLLFGRTRRVFDELNKADGEVFFKFAEIKNAGQVGALELLF